MQVLYALWSIAAWLIAFTVMSLVVIVCLPFTLFIPFEKIQGGWPKSVVGAIPYLTFSRFTVRRDRDHDKKRVSLYVMNHTSMLDGHVAIGALPHPFCGIENAAHLQLPGYGWLMRMANAIPVRKRTEGGQTGQLTAAAIERAGRGISVLAFPEAHRTPDGHVHDFRTGVFRMARDAGLPVVPVAVRGAHKVFPKGRWYVTPGHLDVYIGPTIETANLTDEELEVLSQRCRQIITDYLDAQTTVSPLPEAVTAPLLSA